jgi:queuosine precursor transporter
MIRSDLDHVHAPGWLSERRERVFVIFAGVFLASMAMLNIIGITRFIHIGPLALAVGVLPYPLTFLCTDFISEFYGRRRANFVVTVGVSINLLVLGTLWLGDLLPSVDPQYQPPWQTLHLESAVALPDGEVLVGEVQLFHLLYACMRGAVVASMFAYLAAQFCDVYLFHFWKRLTKGKMLWLRNNGSTMVSQLVDATAVIGITFGVACWNGDMSLGDLFGLIRDNYLFKVAVALADTVPFYVGVWWLRGYLRIDPTQHRD